MQHALNRRSILKIGAALGLLPLSSLAVTGRPYSFNLFFDFESTQLTAGAAELADLVARQILPIARVTLSGHADTAETHPERLSYSRGNEVLKYFLRKQSLARVRFNVVTSGTSALLVKTGPNIREPQNRRVEISMEM